LIKNGSPHVNGVDDLPALMPGMIPGLGALTH